MKLKIHFNHKEELWNSWSHAGGILLGVIVGIIFLYWCFTQHNGWATAGIILYLFGMLMSYIASTTSCHFCLEQVEGTSAQMGSCRHLLAYCRFLLPYHAHSHARTGLLGMEPFYLYLGLRHCRNRHEFCQAQGPQQLRDALLCRHGSLCSRCLQASYRFCFPSHSLVDYCRRYLLHHGCCILQYQQEEIHAFRIPLLCAGRKYLPHHRRLGHSHEIYLNNLRIRIKASESFSLSDAFTFL